MVEWDLKPGSLVLGSVFLVYVTAVLFMELVAWTWSRVLAQTETPYDDGEVLFPLRFPQPISKLMVRLVEHKLCSVTKEWKSADLVCKSTSQPNWVYRRVEVKGRESG